MAEPYIYKKINDKLYLIAEEHGPYPKHEKENPPHTCTMGLVIGEKKAALIDTGAGIGDLAKYVSQFTDLPVIILNTHGHLDHVGANSLFEKSYISQKDVPLLSIATKANRLNCYHQFFEDDPEMLEYAKQNIVGDEPFVYEFIEDDDIIDLGGVELEAVAFPGHTEGSLTFIDRRDNVVFTGDTILFRILLSRSAIPAYIEALDRFAKRTEGIDTLIPGHQWEPLYKSDMYELRQCAADIVNGAPGTPYTLLDRQWLLHQHGKKRIAFTDSKI